MNWDALGALGQALGTLLVFVTLIYLAVQTRSLKKQSEAEARYAFVDAIADINLVIAQDKEVASVWRRGLESPEALDADELMQFLMLIGQCTNLWSVMHQLYEEKLLPEHSWTIVRNDIASILGSNGGKYFWENGGEAAFDARFVDLVRATLASGHRPYDMAAIAEARS